MRRVLGRAVHPVVHLVEDDVGLKFEQLLDPDIELPDVQLVSEVLVHKMGVVSAVHMISCSVSMELWRGKMSIGRYLVGYLVVNLDQHSVGARSTSSGY